MKTKEIDEILKKIPGDKQNEATLEQLFDDYLTSCKAKGLAKETVSSYEQHLKTLGNYLSIMRKLLDYI